MADPENPAKSLRERIGGNAEERVGRALSELLESPLFTGAIGRAFDAREKAAQAQEVAMGALNLPSAADIERLTRRLRSVTHRLEAIEEGVERLDSSLSTRAMETRLATIEQQLQTVIGKLDGVAGALGRRAGEQSKPDAKAAVAANGPAGAKPVGAGRARPGKAAAKARPGKAAAKARPVKAAAKARPAKAAAKKAPSQT